MTRPKAMPTVVLADDHPSVVARVKAMLADDFEVIAAVGNGLDAVQAAIDYRPDLIILDVTMPGLDGIHTAREIRRLQLPSRLIFLSLHEDTDYADAAHSLHASYVVKSRMNIDLSVAIKEQLAGRLFFSSIPAGSSDRTKVSSN